MTDLKYGNLEELMIELLARGDAYCAFAENIIDGDQADMKWWPGDSRRGRPFHTSDVVKFRRHARQMVEEILRAEGDD